MNENIASAAAPATPPPVFGQPPAQPAAAPATPPVAGTPEAAAQAAIGQPPSTGIDWPQIVTIAIISLTFVSLVFQIVVNKKQHDQMGKDETTVKKDINELRYNLKKAMGDKYESIK